MHDSVLRFVRHHAATMLPEADDAFGLRVLDVGALDVNGSARGLFPGAEYVGVDLELGPGVDVQADAHDLTATAALGPHAGTFDLVLCLEMLEHDLRPWETTAELAKMARPGGLVLVTARGNGFPQHNPPDAYRFLEDGFRAVLEAGGLTVLSLVPDPQVSGWHAVCTTPAAEPAVTASQLERRPAPAMPTGVRPGRARRRSNSPA